MWNKIKIREIKKDALDSLKKDYNGKVVKNHLVQLYYYTIPLIISLILLFSRAIITTEIANYFITGISIFAGLSFNLLLAIADKLNVRKRLLDNDINEETKNYVTRYRHFSEQLISQISYCIIISIVLILLMFLTHFSTWLPKSDIYTIKLIYRAF